MVTECESGVDEPILLSALEHYSYCPRQCALIHKESIWDENLYTLRGRDVHERAHEETEITDEVRIERGLPLWSERLGLVGKADVVEFRGEIPYPVEYKYGSMKSGRHANLQLCGQALCLEEMIGQPVVRGAVYHFSSRRRREVEFNAALRERVYSTIKAIRRMLRKSELPAPVNDKRCGNCSLAESCLHAAIARPARIRSLHRTLFIAD
ncbi:CRISPR-associated protein Cas4 [Dehalococcoidia bacterium]|nr:CRISPR-associated protein Cas4 [Dehalococcoidia bacterium]